MPLSTDDHLAILDLAARDDHAIDGGDELVRRDGPWRSTRRQVS